MHMKKNCFVLSFIYGSICNNEHFMTLVFIKYIFFLHIFNTASEKCSLTFKYCNTFGSGRYDFVIPTYWTGYIDHWASFVTQTGKQMYLLCRYLIRYNMET